jgi:phosphoesterase RecJ-like protein
LAEHVKSEIEQFKRVVEQCTAFVLTTHVSPDCDGLGSELALAEFLAGRGKTVSIINHSATPPPYEFLDPRGLIRQYTAAQHSTLLQGADAIIVMDTNQPERLGEMEGPVLSAKAKKVVIDHHLDAHPFASLYLLDDTAAATGEILFTLLEGLGARISATAAHALYIAIMTDTGSFRFPKTDADLHRIVATLIDRGADPVLAYQQVYEQDSPQRVRLLGMVLASLTMAHGGKLAYLTVTSDMLRETGTDESDIERFVPYTLRIGGVQIGLMFTDLGDWVKVSFRSKGEIPINNLAREYGGNGHKNAAGARIHGGNLRDIIQSVLSSAGKYITA